MKQIFWQILFLANVNFRVEGNDIIIANDPEYDRVARFHFEQNKLKGVTIE